MMSSSKVIKKEENPFFQIELFRANEIGQIQQDEQEALDRGTVVLPLFKGPSATSGIKYRNQSSAGELDEEALGDRVARIEREAYEKGFEQGQRDGLALEKKQMEEKSKELEALFLELRNLKGHIYSETEAEILKLSVMIARKVVREEIKTDTRLIGRTIRSTLKYLVDNRKIQIQLNPDDMGEVTKLLPDLAAVTKGGQFQLIEDKAIEAGGCILETGFGKINAGIEDQLNELEKVIAHEFQSSQE